MNKNNRLSLKCFSPEVMIATFVIEIAGAAYILWKYRSSTISKLIVGTLGLLAAFQLAEYMICEQAVMLSALTWAKVGFASISVLPALGLHLALALAGKSSFKMIMPGYAIAGLYVVFFLAMPTGVLVNQCAGNYVIFDMLKGYGDWYVLYYYGWCLAGMGLAAYLAGKSRNKTQRSALRYLALGYATFIVPTGIVNIINPETVRAIPSIMCGFAVFLAIILIFKVAPRALTAAEYVAKQPASKEA